MKYTIYSKDAIRADQIEEALALLRVVDAEHSNEDINEGPEARATRIRMRATARQLVAKMIADIGTPEDLQSSFFKRA